MRLTFVRTVAGFVGLTGLMLLGCTGESGGPIMLNAGASTGVGGSNPSGNGGNTVANGGITSGLGGSAVSGGALGFGGQVQNQGGSVGQGSSVGQSGAVGQGGVATNGGGQTANGGNATGGAKVTGGATANGGNATGGKATGGVANATGGALNIGGVATGGKATAGGTTAAGGAATGGSTSTGTTPITVYMAGDSTMQPCTTACPCGYGSQYQQYFNSNAAVVNRGRGGRSTAQANRGFGPQTVAAGVANNVPVINLTKISAALYTSAGLCPNSSDYTSTTSAVGQFFCADHTHFEAAGASQVAGAVAKAIKDQGIGLAAYLL